MNASPKPKRRWYQFIFPGLLVVMTVATVAFVGRVQYTQYQAQQKQEELAAWLTDSVIKNGGYNHRKMVCGFPPPDDVGETPKQDSPQCEILP
jgi:hypothetical protein